MKTRVLTCLLISTLSFSAIAQEKRGNYVGERVKTLQPDRKIVYKTVGDRELTLHIFEPEGWKPTDRRPCFHIIHGGGWQGMDPSRMYPFAADLAKRYGMVGICPEYRLYKPDKSVTVFDCVEDACSSVRYVRSHPDEFGIDPDKIVVAGASAGGHLAASCALFSDDEEAVASTPNAMVLLFPVIDTSAEGYGQKKIGERWKELSPVDHVRAGLPPSITFHGTGDKTTPFAGAKRFHEEMLAAGNRSELDIHEGGNHGYLMWEETIYEDTITKTAAFLDSLELLKP